MISRHRSFQLLLFLTSICFRFFSGFSQDSNSRTVIKVDAHSSSSSKTGSTILIVCITLAAVAGLSFFLFKLWQKKKRDEQYARLLKLFEQDDELELELGLHD